MMLVSIISLSWKQIFDITPTTFHLLSPFYSSPPKFPNQPYITLFSPQHLLPPPPLLHTTTPISPLCTHSNSTNTTPIHTTPLPPTQLHHTTPSPPHPTHISLNRTPLHILHRSHVTLQWPCTHQPWPLCEWGVEGCVGWFVKLLLLKKFFLKMISL